MILVIKTAKINPIMQSIKITIADLQSKYNEIINERDEIQFYLKIANYGKYILQNEDIEGITKQLYKEASFDSVIYIQAWNKFIKKWKLLAPDLIEKALQVGIEDNINDPFSREISEIKNKLAEKDLLKFDSDLSNYWRPYQMLIWRFSKEQRTKLLSPKHMNKKYDTIKAGSVYDHAYNEWENFKLNRETTVWFAHCHLCRIATGILELKGYGDYFTGDNEIDQLYRYEFSEIKRGNSMRLFLKKEKYLTWIKRFHEYLIPRLEALIAYPNIIKEEKNDKLPLKLKFFENDGTAILKDNQWSFKGKAKALLTYLNQTKNTPISTEEIKQKCNPLVSNSRYYFKSNDDIDDTVRSIKKRLGVKTRDYFPIIRQDNNWYWKE